MPDDTTVVEMPDIQMPLPGFTSREGHVPALPENPTTQLGDVIPLGNHTLVCGDATDPVAYAHMPGPAAATITDPPYFTGISGGKTAVKDPWVGDFTEDEYTQFLTAALTNVASHTEGAVYLFHGAMRSVPVHIAWAAAGLHYSSTIAWVKHHFVLNRADYHWQWEPCLYGWPAGRPHGWYGGRTQANVWEFDRPITSRLHPTMKPVALIEKAMGNSTEEGGLVLDPFAGSGTTLVAAENTGRSSYLIELDPRYCDVIIARWESLLV